MRSLLSLANPGDRRSTGDLWGQSKGKVEKGLAWVVFNAQLWSATNVDLRVELNDLLLIAKCPLGQGALPQRLPAGRLSRIRA